MNDNYNIGDIDLINNRFSELESQLDAANKEMEALHDRMTGLEHTIQFIRSELDIVKNALKANELTTFFELSTEELKCINSLQNNRNKDGVENEYDLPDTDSQETSIEEDIEEDYIDITCPYCNEELSYTIWQIREGELICPMCNGEFVYDEVTGTVSESID